MGPVSGLYSESVYDTSVGLETMKRLLSPFKEYKRAFSLSTVAIETGAIVNLTDETIPIEDLHRAVVASASVPGIFPATEINGMKLVDGMTAYNTNV